ncbi:MAG: sulfatase-like hydrolase/transferase [Planctomycetota bacterium]
MNFVYINPDEMRADVLACYGHPLARTPNLDRLAATGVRFDQCHVQHTVCTPSRCSFMTGWYPHTRGHRTLWHLLRPDEPNTLRYLKQGGYEVHWIGKNDLLSQDSFARSVSRLHCVQGPGGRPQPRHDAPDANDFLAGPLEGHHHDYYSYQRAAEFVRSRGAGDSPFMLFLATGCPHPTYTAPQPWYDMYKPEDVPPLRAPELPDKPDFYRLIREYRGLDGVDEWELRKIMAVYLGMVSYVDDMVGMVLDALDESGRAEDTVVVFFSDHGDWAGDYGLVEKWPSGLDDCLTRVPMIVRAPGCRGGHVVDAPVECFDIMPTTLELAGIEPQHTHFARSMVPQLCGGAGDADRAVFAEGGYDPHEPHCFEGKPGGGICANPDGIYYPKGLQQQQDPRSVCRATMIRTRTHKLVRRPLGVSELYDLTSDPQELRNVHDEASYAPVRSELQERMLDWYVHTSDVVPFDADPRGVTPEVAEALSAPPQA